MRKEKKEKLNVRHYLHYLSFFNTLNLNIIFLSVYRNFLWIKHEWENVKNWNCPPIGKTGALAMLLNHHGNCFLSNFTIWCQSKRKSTCLPERDTEHFILGQTTWTFSQIFFLSGFLTSLRPLYFIYFFAFFGSEASHCGLQPYNHTESHPILQTMKCLFLNKKKTNKKKTTGLKSRSQNEQNLFLLEASKGFMYISCLNPVSTSPENLFKSTGTSPFYWWCAFKSIICTVPDPIPTSTHIPFPYPIQPPV